MALQNVEANITLDLYNHDTTPATVKAIQLDSETRYVAARLQNVGVQYDVDSEATVQLIVVRPDKVGVQITGTTFTYGDESSEYLGPYAELTQVALAVSGKMRGQFKITSGDQILRTEIFAISNGEALDASTDEWADEYDGYNLEEMATSIETNTSDIATLEADVNQIKEDLGDITEISKTIGIGAASVGTYRGEVGETLDETGTSSTYRRYNAIAVTAGQIYRYKVYQGTSNNYKHFAWAANNNNLIIGAYGTPSTEGEYTYEFTIPTGATRLYVMTHIRASGNIYQPLLQLIRYDSLQEQINNIISEQTGYSTVYVSQDGYDGNSGDKNAPLQTINAALSKTAENIYVKAGAYAESINVSDKTVNIYPYDGNEIILQPTGVNNGIYMLRCNVNLVGITVVGSTDYNTDNPAYGISRNGFYIIASKGTLKKCKALGARTAGIRCDGSTITLEGCEASYNGVVTKTDGFNAHDYTDNGTVYNSDMVLTNCVADHNGDDGLSVHEYGIIRVYGGKYTNNGTGGVTPYGQCRAEIYGAYLTNNKFGIDAFQSADATYPDGKSGILDNHPTVLSVGNWISGNSSYGIQVTHYNVLSIGDIFDSNAGDINYYNGIVETKLLEDYIALRDEYNPLSVFTNITCIGDSLTQSQVYTGANTTRQAYTTYPETLANRTGATCTPVAKSGASASQWWSLYSAQIVQKTNQLTIIYLGTNDGLTDTIETDCVGNDYTQWADTNTGCYAKIIAASLAVGSRVLLVKTYAGTNLPESNVAVTNGVIDKMANKFNVAVVDAIKLDDSRFHSYPDGTGTNAVHYNDFGYAAFTDYLIKEVCNLSTDMMKRIIPI